jgi:hypothetical protein
MCGRDRRTTREEELARIYHIPIPAQPLGELSSVSGLLGRKSNRVAPFQRSYSLIGSRNHASTSGVVSTGTLSFPGGTLMNRISVPDADF